MGSGRKRNEPKQGDQVMFVEIKGKDGRFMMNVGMAIIRPRGGNTILDMGDKFILVKEDYDYIRWNLCRAQNEPNLVKLTYISEEYSLPQEVEPVEGGFRKRLRVVIASMKDLLSYCIRSAYV
jgi:hypothetical protein